MCVYIYIYYVDIYKLRIHIVYYIICTSTYYAYVLYIMYMYKFIRTYINLIWIDNNVWGRPCGSSIVNVLR